MDIRLEAIKQRTTTEIIAVEEEIKRMQERAEHARQKQD